MVGTNCGQPATGTGPFNRGRSVVDDDLAADVGRPGPRTGMVARAVSGLRHERIDRRANVLAIRITCSANGMDSGSRPRHEPFSLDDSALRLNPRYCWSLVLNVITAMASRKIGDRPVADIVQCGLFAATH